MGSIFIIAGLFTTLLASVGKLIMGNKNDSVYKGKSAIIRLYFKKGDPLTLPSFSQLLGIVWIIFGIVLNITDTILVDLSGPLLFLIKLFLPLFVVFVIAKILEKKEG